MQKKILIIVVLVLSSISLKAQQISPTDLFDIYKVWETNDPIYYKYAYQDVKTVDKRWTLAYAPDEKNGMVLIFGFKLDSTKWYKPAECELSLVNDHTRPIPKGINYAFTDIATWNMYNHQMVAMNAKRIADGSVGGGHQVIYQLNDLVIFLKEFPPGINGDDRIYEVQLGHEPPNN
jgi:hypothetical protein